jgi:tripartite-type tricarboxylate transporter receptor subunit TctC
VRLGTQPHSNTPDEFAAYIKSETAKYANVIKAAKINPE